LARRFSEMKKKKRKERKGNSRFIRTIIRTMLASSEKEKKKKKREECKNALTHKEADANVAEEKLNNTRYAVRSLFKTGQYAGKIQDVGKNSGVWQKFRSGKAFLEDLAS